MRHASRPRRRASDIDKYWTALLIRMRAFGRRRALAVAVFGLLGFGGSALMSVVRGGPLPAIHDEFSYLLAADTFANWRLTNPAHPHWEHFETYHVITLPTYASKYPPAQGLVLALGQVVTGSPETGVWLGAGIMTAAIAWMLLTWLPPHWAMLAGIFATVQLSWISYWGHSYWGGAIAAAGGALAFGALRASFPRARFGAGIVLGLGLAILAASRPYEGAVVGVSVCIALGLRLVSARGAERAREMRTVLAAACVVMMALAWLGYYNWRVTGSPLTMPYQVYQAQYSSNPFLLFGTQRAAPVYRHAQMERLFREWGQERKQYQRSLVGWLTGVPLKLVVIISTLLGVGSLALIGFPGIARRSSLRFVLATVAAVVAAALLTAGSFPHYVAPIAALMYVVIGTALCHLHRRARRKRATNFALVVAFTVAVTTPLILVRAASAQRPFARARADIQRQLESLPTKSLVLVVYGPTHNIHQEWVYNRADIDSAWVVWARSMSREQNQRLIDYFPGRTVWRFAPGEAIALQPYAPDVGSRTAPNP